MFKEVKETLGKKKKKLCTGASAATLLLSGSSVPESPGGRKLWNCGNKKQTRNPAAQEAWSLDAGLKSFANSSSCNSKILQQLYMFHCICTLGKVPV